MTPRHGTHTAQTGRAPVEIIVSPTTITSGTRVTVTIRSTQADFLFNGFKIIAIPHIGGNSFGSFVPRANEVQTTACFGANASAATHPNNAQRSSIDVERIAPTTANVRAFNFV